MSGSGSFAVAPPAESMGRPGIAAIDPAAVLLHGALDTHVHACPHINRRRVDALEAARSAYDAGLRGIVLIDNFAVSSGLAGLAEERLTPERPFSVLGGIVLNHQVGLINPAAVDTAIAYGNGASFVSLPTHHTRHVALAEGRDRTSVERAFAVPERVGGALAEVLDLVADHDLVFNTGHIAGDEALRAVSAAAERGIRRILVPAVGYDHDVLRQLADLGAYVEFTFFFTSYAAELPLTHIDGTPTTTARTSPVEVAQAIRAVGPEHCVVSSDAGSWVLPPPVESLRCFVAMLLALGFSEDDVRAMVASNPRRLFDHRIHPD